MLDNDYNFRADKLKKQSRSPEIILATFVLAFIFWLTLFFIINKIKIM